MRLSRNFYEAEEVKLSYFISLLYKTSLDEVYFWILELFYSFGFEETKDHIWKVYYDFYYCKNHNMKEWLEQNDITDNCQFILSVSKNLFNMEWNTSVFEMRMYYNSKSLPTVIYRRLPKKLDKYSKQSKKVIQSINKGDLKNICSYLHYCSGNEPVSHKEIIQYINPEYIWGSNNCGGNNLHILLAEIVFYYTKQLNDNSNYLIEDNLNIYKNINFKNLSHSRKYKIQHEYIGCFKLSRMELSFDNYSIYKNWHTYCFNTKFWKEQFDNYGCVIKNSEVQFNSEINEELFNSDIGYYIDEFPSITNDYNCFCDIEELNYNDFMKLISGRTTAISSDYKEIIY